MEINGKTIQGLKDPTERDSLIINAMEHFNEAVQSIDKRLGNLEATQRDREDKRDVMVKSEARRTAMVTAIITVFGFAGTLSGVAGLVIWLT